MVNSILNMSVVHSCKDLLLQMFALFWSPGEKSRLAIKSQSKHMDGSRNHRNGCAQPCTWSKTYIYIVEKQCLRWKGAQQEVLEMWEEN